MEILQSHKPLLQNDKEEVGADMTGCGVGWVQGDSLCLGGREEVEKVRMQRGLI